MTSLDIIQSPIKKELKDFEAYFKQAIKSDIPLLEIVIRYILRKKGKQMRPMFVFLSAKILGEFNESTLLAASGIELLHTATLLHDDVVDESYERRGSFSINALWKNKIAVLVGDYILARGFLNALDENKYRYLHLISRAVKDMSEGEILQMRKSRKLDIDFDTYFEIIRKKTASLIATSMAMGAASVTEDDEQIEKMFQIGLDVGIAFQIKDDIFDYQSKGILGKPTGNDIKEKKITLPLLYVLEQSTKAEKRRILGLVKKKNKNAVRVKELVDLVVAKGGLEYAEQRMNEFKDKAIGQIRQLPESESRESLIELVNYTTTRKK
ncbi:MAG: polyprenyl synthetase [Bacteroidetes bacterium GWF2_42_66]|nr:MAG: polyprenyl synthetase [Bacteroidetes bacterium GWA2_42_15]OFX98457.1 MAG: polyprenyl synthetase [Bacteroidetes bacterium GWE2_42_39]OFY42842.1 MAG: polyprenyl synthetase [Bacteroidetes bacterium GWF2_42_66]HBL74470.1 polyprenyl synthetase [Prolixibacteraceae bacterium]HCR90863.1 polyprenyl synthetase [Prolixibacteraceae bacterium]